MSNVAIRVENLGKLYRIGGPQERYKTLRDSIVDMATAPFRRARDLVRGQAYGASGLKEEIWALKDVSFEVKHGEVVGIIGRNGAGKSTLLKILSRITEPTTGYADVYGRVGALLEVGTGFHPELTGRENVYLNGAILGMSRRDIDRKFDEIVAFAEIDKFIDTPVKHYSSGMGLRLGFAVAAHLEPEVLIVDEVLAVGDIAFQKKCLGKMRDVSGEGRTVLFVSHNMAAVETLTGKSVLLEKGCVKSIGDTASVIDEYFSLFARTETGFVTVSDGELGPSSIRSIEILHEGSIVSSIPMGASLAVRVHIDSPIPLANGHIGIGIETIEQGRVLSLGTRLVGYASPRNISVQRGVFTCYIDSLPLNHGTYYLTVVLSDGYKDLQRLERVCKFHVVDEDVFGTGASLGAKQGVFFVPHKVDYRDLTT